MSSTENECDRLILVNFARLSFDARTYGMALVLFNAKTAHRTGTIGIGAIDCGKFTAQHRIRGKIEIIRL